MQGGWFGAMERIHNLASRAREPNGQNEGDQSYFAAFWHWAYAFFLLLLRGQQSNLDKLDKIAKVNIGRGLVMFLSLPFSSPPQSLFQTLFCLVNPLPGFSVKVQWDKTTPPGLSGAGLRYGVWRHCRPPSQLKLHSLALEKYIYNWWNRNGVYTNNVWIQACI